MSRPSDPRLSFDEVADIYDEIRPTYPAAVFDYLFGLVPRTPLIVEVGAGTGKATRDLLKRGAVVHAIEIGPAMAAKLRTNLWSKDLHVSVGDFETLDLRPRSADLVFAATAYHWISPAAQLDRPATVLKPDGAIAIVDLIQVDSPDDHGFFAAVQPIYERYGEGRVDPPSPTRDTVDPPIRHALERDPRFTDVALRAYDWNQTYTAAEYRKLMLSYSGTQMMEPTQRSLLLNDMETFINVHFGGHVTRPLVVTLTTARLA